MLLSQKLRRAKPRRGALTLEWILIITVLVIFFVGQFIEGYVLAPKLVGESVGLHPVWVMLAIIGFASVFGLVGLLLAIPIAVLIKLLIENMVDETRETSDERSHTLELAVRLKGGDDGDA